MYRKFSSFAELTDDFKSRDGIAVRCADEEDVIRDISYKELAEMILAEVPVVKAEPGGVKVIVDEQSPETLVSIFANVIAGRDIILADPMIPGELTAQAAAAADAAKAARAEAGAEANDGEEGEILFFTSGTTSRSKIVRLTSRSLCTSAWSGQSMLACGPDDIHLSVLPLAHVFGFVCAMLWGLAYGSTIALGRGVRHMVDDALFFKPTIFPAVPALISAAIKFNTLNPELRVVLIGAAPCSAAVTDFLRAKGIDVYLGYGLTETSSGIAITQDLDEPEAMYLCPGADIRIEADDEVSVATPCMMQGYVGGEQMSEGDRFFTGDLGWFDEKGRLHLKGRKKDVILMPDGTKIFCPEYEEDLARLSGLPDLGIATVDGRAVLVAGSCSDDPAVAGDLREKLLKTVKEYNSSLSRSQQIYGVIVRAEALPRTATGKLKRYELQEQLQ